jgi:glycosyltransferase involved in cell wall biosynthesis
LIKARGVESRIKIVGHVDDAPAAFAVADVGVIASTEAEAFGRTAVEASAMGLPVVATALGATGETVLSRPAVSEEERTGWLVPPGEPAALASAIGEALALSPEERTKLGERARRHAQNFATATMQQATLALYDRLLPRPGSSSPVASDVGGTSGPGLSRPGHDASFSKR